MGGQLRHNPISGYEVLKPNKAYGHYTDNNTLRYVVLKRSDITCLSYLVDTGVDRPLLNMQLTAGDRLYDLVAIHAPSVTTTWVPQADALRNGLANWPLEQSEPIALFGDFNVDAKDDHMREAFISEIELWSEMHWAKRYHISSKTGSARKRLRREVADLLRNRRHINPSRSSRLLPFQALFRGSLC